MNSRTRIAAAFATAALLAACSSSPEAEPTPTAAPTSAATAEAPSPTPAAPSESPNMPDVVGMPAAEARELLVAERLKVEFFDAATGEEISEASFDSSTVQVVSQQPLAGDPKVDSALAWLTVDIGTTSAATSEPAAGGIAATVQTALAGEGAVILVTETEAGRLTIMTSLEDPGAGIAGSPEALDAIRICETAVAAAQGAGYPLTNLTVTEDNESSWILWGHPSVPVGVCTEV